MQISSLARFDLQWAKPLLLASILVLSPLTQPAFAQDADQSDARHMLWRVASQDGTTEGYLVGSVHAMKEDAYPLDPVFEDAFSEAEVLAFEVNYDSMQVKARSLVGRLAVYPEGKTLESELDPETYSMLASRTEKLNMNLVQLQRMEPWMISVMIPTAQMQRAGYSEEWGIDQHFFDKAKEADKPRRAFETAEEQLRLFDDLPPEKQEAYLRYSLEQADRTVENIDQLVHHWKSGNAEGIDSLVAGKMRVQAPDLYEVLITNRNEQWMTRLTDLLEADEQPMVVVGAGHLVGEDGLVQMLDEKGYQLEQL